VNLTLGHIGDRINPIVVKEVRQAVNSRIVAGALLLFLGVQMVVMTLQLTFKDFSPNEGFVDLRAGRQIFAIVQGILVGTCILIIPAFTGARLMGERSDVNVDLMFITSLSPWKIISGKFVGAAALALLIFSACAPFMTFAYILRGLDVPTILIVLLADFLAVLLGTIFTIFLASIPASRGFRILLALVGIIALGYLTAGAVGASVALLEFEVEINFSSKEFWLSLAGASTLAVGAIGLFFMWSIALVSPVSANRALPVRLFTLGLWLVTGVGCVIWSNYVKEAGPILGWGVIGSFLFSLQLLIAVSERDELGPRVSRRIPERMLFRVPAFLFFSGAAGGIAFAVIGGVLSIAAIGICHSVFPDLHWFSKWEEAPILGALVFAYTYCYCVSAVLVRRFGKGRGLQSFHTWAIAFIIFGLGSALPFIIDELLSDRTYGRYRVSEFHPMFLPSPIMTVDDAMRSMSQIHLTILFLAIWGIVVTFLNGYWFTRQITLFRPPTKPKEDIPPAILRKPEEDIPPAVEEPVA
jgi:hypothetical protein